ncbi:hypothetical protein HK104_009647, partial [Borealophlyctis nickersoniae]
MSQSDQHHQPILQSSDYVPVPSTPTASYTTSSIPAVVSVPADAGVDVIPDRISQPTTLAASSGVEPSHHHSSSSNAAAIAAILDDDASEVRMPGGFVDDE